MRTTVTCYAGYRADERPTSFTIGNQTRAVAHVLQRRRDPDTNHFRVRADNGQVYELAHHLADDSWTVSPAKSPH